MTSISPTPSTSTTLPRIVFQARSDPNRAIVSGLLYASSGPKWPALGWAEDGPAKGYVEGPASISGCGSGSCADNADSLSKLSPDCAVDNSSSDDNRLFGVCKGVGSKYNKEEKLGMGDDEESVSGASK